MESIYLKFSWKGQENVRNFEMKLQYDNWDGLCIPLLVICFWSSNHENEQFFGFSSLDLVFLDNDTWNLIFENVSQNMHS